MGVGRITVEYHAINNMAPPPAQNSCDYAIFAMYFWMPDQTHTKFSMHLHSERSRSKQLHVRHRALDAGWTLGAGYTSTQKQGTAPKELAPKELSTRPRQLLNTRHTAKRHT